MSQTMPQHRPIYGLMAEFTSSHELLRAIRASRASGYTKMDAYTPYPIEEVWEELGHHRSKLPAIVLTGALIGIALGFGLQYWASVINYPLNIGGRPLNSWPAFIPITFEVTILVATLFAVAGMFVLNGLPMPFHPVFNVKRFALASRDRYFLCIEADDLNFDREATAQFLQNLNPTEVSEVAG
ncbi:MAG: DUF3341 domain-containing protein [Acidobacteriota bacterium]|nr:DUF3341 domain-containing protein [Acidobacteriota bacterium]